MKFFKKGCYYKFKLLEKTNSGVRFLTIYGKLDRVDDLNIWVNGENFKIEDILTWDKE